MRFRGLLTGFVCSCALLAAPPLAAAPSPDTDAVEKDTGPSEASRAQAAKLKRRSMQLIAQEKWGQAEAVLEEALSLVPSDPVNLYNLACVRARLGRPDAAVESLENAAAAGFSDFFLIGRDPDLGPLRGLPRFKSLLANKAQWQHRAAEGALESLRQRFGEEYLYSVDFDQKLIFATNIDEQTLAELKDALKSQAAAQQKELFTHKPDAFVTVVVPSARDYRKLMRMPNVGGMYLDGSKTLVAQRLGEAMRHEFTHALHAADRAPLGQDHAAWVAEGLGVMYEAVDRGPDGASFEPRADNPRYVVAQAAARRRSLIPLDRLVKMSPAEFLARPNLTYPESGALMFYLRERGLLKKLYDAYKATYDADPTGAKALERATGQTVGGFEAEWTQWLIDRAADDPRRGHAPFLGASLKPEKDGLAVMGLQIGGPAVAAGLEPGDLLLAINGHPVRDYAALRPAIGAYAPGKTVTLTVRREGKQIELALKLPGRAREGAEPPSSN